MQSVDFRMQNAEPARLASRRERAIILHFAFSILNERQGVMSAADGLVRNEEVAGASPATLTILWKAGRYKLAAPVLKTGSVYTEVGALPTPSATVP